MTETETEAADRDSSIRLARFALAAHIKGSPGAAVEAVETLYVHFGGRGLVCALATWADAWHHHASAGQATTVSGPPSILDRETGDEWDPADPSVPDDVAWATQLVYAYCKNDDDRFFGLIRELIDAKDSEKASRHVQTVLALVSGSIRNLPAGFGLLLNDRPGVMS